MGYLDSLGIKYGTDKSSKCHDYLDFYEDIFESYFFGLGSDVKLLEIGVRDGSSVKMWRDFFGRNSVIIGIDKETTKGIYGAIVTIADAYSKEGLNYIKTIRPPILIDDGSHKSYDIITLIDFLLESKDNFPYIFIYEDCHAAFFEEYTPKGTKNAYHYALEKFDNDPQFIVKIHKRFDDFSDSVTMVVIKNW